MKKSFITLALLCLLSSVNIVFSTPSSTSIGYVKSMRLVNGIDGNEYIAVTVSNGGTIFPDCGYGGSVLIPLPKDNDAEKAMLWSSFQKVLANNSFTLYWITYYDANKTIISDLYVRVLTNWTLGSGVGSSCP